MSCIKFSDQDSYLAHNLVCDHIPGNHVECAIFLDKEQAGYPKSKDLAKVQRSFTSLSQEMRNECTWTEGGTGRQLLD